MSGNSWLLASLRLGVGDVCSLQVLKAKVADECFLAVFVEERVCVGS